MTPYGPSYVKAQIQNDQILWLGGDSDGVTPTASYSAVLEGVILSGTPGGLQAELVGGTHCNPVCGNEFGVFGEVGLLWFDMFLRDADNCVALMNILVSGPQVWNLTDSSNFVCAGI